MADHLAPQVHRLPYREPRLGRDYWVLDDALPNPHEVCERMLGRTDWTQGAPYRPESWPGMRAQPALQPAELAPLEDWVRAQTGRKRLFKAAVGGVDQLNHNCIQGVAAHEASARPHTDSRALCRCAAVLYLSSDGTLGGNTRASRHAHLVEALGTRFVPPNLFVPDVSVDYRFNRLLLYRADLIHSATTCFGNLLAERRMAAVFFWMAS